MNQPIEALVRLYRAALRLYPAAYRAQFGDELVEVFEQSLQEAGARGSHRLLARLSHELCDLPGVLLRVHLFRRLPEMDIQLFPHTVDRAPWGAALLSLLPLLLAGPFFLIMSYSSTLFPQAPAWLLPFYLGMTCFALIGGLILGAIRQFPRWCYPYAGYALIVLTFLATYLWNRTPWNVDGELWILLLVASLLVLLTAWLPFFKPFYTGIWRDWTRLSYTLYAGTLLFVSVQDHDISPRLTVLILLPSLIWLAGALVHLRLASARLRVAILVFSSLLAFAVWMLPIIAMEHNTLAYFFQMYRFLVDLGGVLAALVLAPVLIGAFAFNRLEKRPAA
jgi:hypothetical protein